MNDEEYVRKDSNLQKKLNTKDEKKLQIQMQSQMQSNKNKITNTKTQNIKIQRNNVKKNLSDDVRIIEHNTKIIPQHSSNSIFRNSNPIPNINFQKEKEKEIIPSKNSENNKIDNLGKNSNLNNVSLKDLKDLKEMRISKQKHPSENLTNNLSQSIENFQNENLLNTNQINFNNLNQISKSISFGDDPFQKSKSLFSEMELNSNLNFYNCLEKNELSLNDINVHIENLKTLRLKNLKQFREDSNLAKISADFFKEKLEAKGVNQKSDSTYLLEFKTIIECLNKIEDCEYENFLENEIFICLLRLSFLFETENKQHLIEKFLKNFGIINLINIFNTKLINSKILFIVCYILNQLVIEYPNLLEDVISYQFFFYVTKMNFFFQEIEIKIELIFMIYQILFNNPFMIKVRKSI
jgi:hypothetical protein